MVKNLPIMQASQVQTLGQEDPPEKKMATHSSILAWRIPWTEKPSRLQSIVSQRVGQNWETNTMISSVQLLSRVQLFATPWIAARQASLSITNSGSSPKLMCIESVMPILWYTYLKIIFQFLVTWNFKVSLNQFKWWKFIEF